MFLIIALTGLVVFNALHLISVKYQIDKNLKKYHDFVKEITVMQNQLNNFNKVKVNDCIKKI